MPLGVWMLFLSVSLFPTKFMAILDYYKIQTGKNGIFFIWITEVKRVLSKIVTDNLMGLHPGIMILLFVSAYRTFEKQ